MTYDSYLRQTETLSDREKEALLFEKMRGRVILAMRSSEFSLERAKVIADLRRLWSHIATLAADQDNKLPKEIRANIVSIALAMVRDLDEDKPDLDFQAEVLGNFAAGLRSHATQPQAPQSADMSAAVSVERTIP